LHTAADAGDVERRTAIGDDGRIEFVDVLMVGGEGMETRIGAPFLSGAKVVAELVEQTRGPKLIAFKKRRRKNSRRKRGHRQDLTKIRIMSVVA
jgi:large subunit ribosomal protein L21